MTDKNNRLCQHEHCEDLFEYSINILQNMLITQTQKKYYFNYLTETEKDDCYQNIKTLTKEQLIYGLCYYR